jgi:hypothetical protein
VLGLPAKPRPLSAHEQRQLVMGNKRSLIGLLLGASIGLLLFLGLGWECLFPDEVRTSEGEARTAPNTEPILSIGGVTNTAWGTVRSSGK